MTYEDERIEAYERKVKKVEREWKELWGTNNESPTAQLAYYNDVMVYKHILKMLYVQADRPVCWGASDCLHKPVTRCNGEHETCEIHASGCLACQIEKEKGQSA
jgi:hypothetical protein